MTRPNHYLNFKQKTVFVLMCLLSNTVVLAQTGPEHETTALEARHAWVREAPPTHNVSVAYLELINRSDEQVQLVAAESPIVRAIELHTATQRGDTMGMARLESIGLPPKSRVQLQPGGIHLMLIGLQRAPRTGETVPLTLIFADESRLTVIAEVRSTPPSTDVSAGANAHRH